MGSVGNDTLTGGAGNDTFIISDIGDNDTTTDFAHGQDRLDMTGVSGLTRMSQLDITSKAQGVKIAYATGSILLQGVTGGFGISCLRE
jgi:Ca2+-binding RTX toxin-like protein